jgi:hypothetical protein
MVSLSVPALVSVSKFGRNELTGPAESLLPKVRIFRQENRRFLPCWQLSQMEMNPVDHWAFSQIIEKWRKTLADSQIELTATQVLDQGGRRI